MNNLWTKFSLTAAATLWTVGAVAATTATSTAVPSEAVSTTTQTAVAAPAKKSALPVSVAVDSTYYGAKITDPNSDTIPDDSIDSKTGSYLRNKIGFKLKLTDKISVAPTLDFEYQLGDPSASRSKELQFRWKDSYLKIAHNDLLTTPIAGAEFNVAGDIRLFAPTSLGARQSDTIGAARITLDESLSPANSRFSLANEFTAKYWVQTNQENPVTKAALPQWEFYAGPQLNFKANDNVNLFVLYEAILHFNTFGQSDVSNYAVSNTDLEPGANIKLNDNITLSPFLNWYTNQSITTTSFNVNAIVKLL